MGLRGRGRAWWWGEGERGEWGVGRGTEKLASGDRDSQTDVTRACLPPSAPVAAVGSFRQPRYMLALVVSSSPATMAITHAAFFYGTLMHPRIISTVLQNDAHHLRLAPAIILVRPSPTLPDGQLTPHLLGPHSPPRTRR